MRRRTFLSGGAAAAVAPLPSRNAQDIVAIFSDIHISPGSDSAHRRSGLERCVREVLALPQRPAHLLVLGDYALYHGLDEDYAEADRLLKPIADAGISIRICMGNHDKRDAFLRHHPEYSSSPVPGKIVSVVETPHVDFLLLDSLWDGHVEGTLGDDQWNWLAKECRVRTKPFFVCAHHPLHELKCGRRLMYTPQCRGFINGHRHVWEKGWTHVGDYRARYTFRTLGIPSTGHNGDIGWALCSIGEKRMDVRLFQHDFYFPYPETANPPADWAWRVEENKGQFCAFDLFGKKPF